MCFIEKATCKKILDLLEMSDLISNEIEDTEEKKCVLTFIILNTATVPTQAPLDCSVFGIHTKVVYLLASSISSFSAMNCKPRKLERTFNMRRNFLWKEGISSLDQH